MHKLTFALTALLAIAAPFALSITTAGSASAAPAHDGGSACISRAEYRSIHRGTTRARVTALAGYYGRRAEGHARSYRACGGARRVLVEYSARNRVQHKYRVAWLAYDPLAR